MLEQELVRLVKSFLAKRSEGATTEECHAWEEFFVTYDVVVRVNIARIHHALDIVDDVAQEAWIVLIRKLPRRRFDPLIGSIAAWVSKIAHRLAAKRARRNAKRRARSLSETQADTLVDAEPGPDVEFERMQEHELFGALVGEFAASLIPRDGRIVILHWLEACPLSKIASDLNMSVGVAWGVLRRVRPKLLDYLRSRGFRRTQENLS